MFWWCKIFKICIIQIFKDLQGPRIFFQSSRTSQGLLKDPVYNTGDVAVQDTCYNQKLTEGHLLSREITENLDSP